MRAPTLLTFPGARTVLGLSFALALFVAAPARGNGPGERGWIYSSSDWIEKAQGILQHEGYLDANSYQAGKNDTPTESAIKAFQINHMLVPTGLIDEVTLAEILSHAGPMDNDRDSVADEIDRCPDTPWGTRVDAMGCPQDADNDTIADNLDRCPGTPDGARVDSEGCPTDSDLDAVYDGLDRCGNTPTGAMVDSDGCPIDSDRDAVFDGLDRCPGTTFGATVDTQGCPRENRPAAIYEEQQSLILEGVRFEPNTATLTPESRETLDRVARILTTRPDATFEIAGYTDELNTTAYNIRLSQRRAEVVRAYLVEQGVEPTHLLAKGYGESSPIADNDTATGRAQNRRVEIAQTN